MLEPRAFLPALHGLLTLTALLAAASAAAEGRDDPFLKCVFADGREVVLAEDGDNTAWIEGGLRTPAFSTAGFRSAVDPLVTLLRYGPAGAERLDVFAPQGEAPGNRPAPLAALLSRTEIAGGALVHTSTPGNCEEFTG